MSGEGRYGNAVTRLKRRSWLTLLVAVAATVLALALALPVSTSAYGEGTTPPCGSPLLHGVNFTSGPTFNDGSTYSDWVSSSLCGQARAERFLEIMVFAGLFICLGLTTLVLLRQRRSLLDSEDSIFVGGGVIAALVNPVLGPLIGLLFAKQSGTRRMLLAQFLANLGFVVAVGFLGLAGLVGNGLPGYPGSLSGSIEIAVLVLLAAAPVAFPLSLLIRPRPSSIPLAATV